MPLLLDTGVLHAVAAGELAVESTIATTDHRDFAVMRPVHVPAFELVP
jgi:hypothetical protein